jgi:very-short-patch-repair endonuclease
VGGTLCACRLCLYMGDKADAARLDQRIAEIAARQHGRITTRQLAEVGLGRRGVSRRVKAGRLHRLHRGVYAVGHSRQTREGRWMAAVLACGPGAVLSHRTAAALWGMRPQSSGPIEVTVPGTGGRGRRAGLLIHRSTCLDPSTTARINDIPVTTPARTISDLRRILPPDQLHAAIRRAEVLRLDVGVQPGYAPDLARSELERMVLRTCRRHRLPMPEVNARVGRYWVDFLWRDRGLIVETDGFRHHGTRAAFESDRERDIRLKLMGFTVVRFTHRQVSNAGAFAATLASLLDLE